MIKHQNLRVRHSICLINRKQLIKMRIIFNVTLLLLVVILIESCLEGDIETKKEVIPFQITRNLSNSSNDLNSNDTLEILFDLSACALRQYSYLKIIKQNENIKLNVTNTGDLSDTTLNKTYKLRDFKLDSILTNELIKNLEIIESIVYQGTSQFSDCIISYKDDTIFLKDTAGLTSKLTYINKFNLIMKKEFSNSSVFNQLPIPKMIEPND